MNFYFKIQKFSLK